MDTEKIIGRWYTLGLGGDIQKDDIFFRFIALWVAFNALYASHHANVNRDSEQVRLFALEREAIDRHQQLVQSDPEYLQAVRILKQRGVDDTRANRSASNRTALIEQENDFSDVALCVYRVRNNLFHGRKIPESMRDESVVRASYIILSKIIEVYVPKKQD